jgi:flagellin
MSLSINNNLMAMNAARNLSTSFSGLADSTRKLSSGLRVDSAADDAAGLAIRELMRADIASLNQGVRNANDAISLIQTADGALQVIDEKLIRMKELATQASTGTYNSDQRLIIDSEYQAMLSEIDRIANATDFNGIYLLNGNLSGENTDHDGSGLDPLGPLKVHFGTANDSAEDYYYISISSATSSAMFGGSATPKTFAELDAEFDSLVTQATAAGGGDPFANFAIGQVTNAYDTAIGGGPPSTPSEFETAYANAVSTATGLLGGNAASDAAMNVFINSDISLTKTESSSISTQQLAQQALEKIEDAIVSKDTIRANLGALQNRLSNTITNLEIQAENIQAAESQISDVDVATEMTTFTRHQILTNAAVSMLAQANNLPQMAMRLLN